MTLSGFTKRELERATVADLEFYLSAASQFEEATAPRER